MRGVALVTFILLCGCLDSSTAVDAVAGETSTGESRATDGPNTTSSTADSTSSAETSLSDASSESDGSGCSFLCNDDSGPSAFECSVIEQDCPRDAKCNAWANDGGSSWNAAKCFPAPVEPDGVDEPCTVEGSGVSGLDSCERGSICWNVDPKTLSGSCMPYCTGSNNAPTCEDPERWCHIASETVVPLCLPYCDPLTPVLCSEGRGCYPDDGHFTCSPDVSGDGGGPLEPCTVSNGCDPGSFCVSARIIGACGVGVENCCSPYCDLGAPACPQGTTCVPFFDEGQTPVGYHDVGFCGQPGE